MGEIIPIDIQASFSIEDKKMNGKFKLLASSLLLAAALGVSSQANALVIDTFDTTFQQAQANGGSSGTSGQVAASEAIGGYRRLDITSTGSVNQNGTIAANADPGKLTVSNDSSISSVSSVLWNANKSGTGGLGGIDLTDGGQSTAFLLSFLTIDFSSATIKFEVKEKNIAGDPLLNGGLASLTLTGLVPGVSEFFYSQFTNFANVDFTQVQFIKMTVTALSGSDLALDMIETNRLPEPSSLVLMSLGLAGFSFMRRKKAA